MSKSSSDNDDAIRKLYKSFYASEDTVTKDNKISELEDQIATLNAVIDSFSDAVPLKKYKELKTNLKEKRATIENLHKELGEHHPYITYGDIYCPSCVNLVNKEESLQIVSNNNSGKVVLNYKFICYKCKAEFIITKEGDKEIPDKLDAFKRKDLKKHFDKVINQYAKLQKMFDKFNTDLVDYLYYVDNIEE